MHEELLPEGAIPVASILAQWPAMQQFYLAGGTGLALHLGHRQSRDLDFFTRDPRDELPSLNGQEEVLAQFGTVEREMDTTEQKQWRLDGISVTLLAYPFAHHFPYQMWRGLSVADARDIAIHKAYTVGRPAQARDYLDLHAVLTHGLLSFEELIRWAQETYQEAFSPRLFLQQLTYTQDIPDRESAVSLLVTPQSFDTVIHDLDIQVKTWTQRRFQPPPPSTRGPRL